MRHLLLACLTLLPLCALAQTTPPKGSTVLYVALPDSSKAAWQRVARAFVASGFAIKSSDEQLLTLTTEPTPVTSAVVLTASASVQGRVAALRGSIEVPTLETGRLPLSYKGMQGGVYKTAWTKLHEVANRLGGTITYGK